MTGSVAGRPDATAGGGEGDGHDQLTAEVRRLKTRSGRRRALPRLLNVGTPGGPRLLVPIGPGARPGQAADRSLAADVLTRALDRTGEPSRQQVWLTRSGALQAGDDDWRWRVATTVARSRYAVEAGAFYVITRHGWLELPSGASRTWSRMRPSWQAPHDDARDDPEVPDPIDGWPVGF